VNDIVSRIPSKQSQINQNIYSTFSIATRSKMDNRNIATTVSDFNPVTPSIAQNKITLRSTLNHLLTQTPHCQFILLQHFLYNIDNLRNVSHSAA